MSDPFKYNPRLASEPDEGLAVNVDLPDNATPDEMIDAIHEAARFLGLEQ